ncbi:MAG: PQQ-binding-like beta-propeller repeat protein [Fuerstiella sp.]
MLQSRTACAVLVLSLSFSSDFSYADWPTHRGNDQRTGYREQSLSSTRWKPAWINDDLDAPAPAWPAPAEGSLWQELTSMEPRVTDDRGDVPLIAADTAGNLHVLIGASSTDRLVSLNPMTGKQQWQFIADAPIRYAPCIHGGTAFVGSDDGLVRAIDLRDGALLWKTRIGPELPQIIGNGRLISLHPIRTSLVTSGDLVYANAGLFPSQGVYTAALNAADGSVVWRRRTQRSPQGYLLTDSRQRLYIPCGRAAPYSVAMDSGRFVSDLPSAGGSFCMLTNEAFFSGPGDQAGVQSYPNIPKAKMLSLEGRAIAAGKGFVWIANGSELQCHDLPKLTTRATGSLLWSTDCGLQEAMIVSGDDAALSVYLAGGQHIRLVDAHTGKVTGELEIADASDRIRYLAVAAAANDQSSDILVATTSSGRVYGWKGGSVQTKTADWPEFGRAIPSQQTVAPDVQHRVQEALSKLSVDVGLALLVNDIDGSCAEQIMATSRLNVISVVPTAAERDSLRLQFLSRQQYGRRMTVLHVTRDQPLPFSDRLFNLVLEATESDRDSRELGRMVDSGTGVVGRYGQPPKTARPFSGGGVWRHQYASPNNSADSGDTAIGSASGFRLQWFGGVGPSRMPDRHLRGQAPLAAGSAMVLHGDECLIGVDPANGVERWHVDLPADAMRYVMPYDAGYSCLTRDGTVLYTAAAAELWKLNAFTGAKLAAYKIPAQTKGMNWGYVAESHGRLFASAMKPSAGRLKGHPQQDTVADSARLSAERAFRRGQFDRATLREKYTKQDYDSTRPLVCSRWLFGLNGDGSQRWSYPSTGVVANSSISLNEKGTRLLFIEGTSDTCVQHATDRVRVADIVEDAMIVCLDTASGKPVWKQPLNWPGARNILYTQVVDDFVVLASSESKEQGAYYHVGVLQLSTGKSVWTKQHAHITDGLGHGEQVHHPLALRQQSGKVCLIAEPYLYDLATGERIVPDGASPDWVLKRPGHSCGTLSGAGQCVFFRATNPTVLNLSSETTDRFQRLSPSRPGCWINMLPVNGRLLIPEGSASCVCAFPLQTSIGFVPINSSATEVPLLEDFPPLAEERIQELYAWRFDQAAVDGDQIRPAIGSQSLTAAAAMEFTDDGLVLDGQQWLAIDREHPDLPAMPATISLEAHVMVADNTPEWSGLVGAVQDNGDFERGSLLGIHDKRFFFAVASEQRPSLTYLESPTQLNHGKRYHLVGTFDGSNMRLYIDGILTGISSAQGGAVLFEQKSWLSAGIYKDDDDHHPLRGVLSRVAVFRGALPPEQVRQRVNMNRR